MASRTSSRGTTTRGGSRPNLGLQGQAARAFASIVYAEVAESILTASHGSYEAWRAAPAAESAAHGVPEADDRRC